jgi:hypothetical protein
MAGIDPAECAALFRPTFLLAQTSSTCSHEIVDAAVLGEAGVDVTLRVDADAVDMAALLFSLHKLELEDARRKEAPPRAERDWIVQRSPRMRALGALLPVFGRYRCRQGSRF